MRNYLLCPATRSFPTSLSLKELARRLRKESTKGEVLLWKQIRNKESGVGFHRQVPIDHYIVDFYCQELRLAIEMDGGSHDEVRFEQDMKRQQRLESLGVRLVRFTEQQIRQQMRQVVESLEELVGQLLQSDASGEHPPLSPFEGG